MTQAYLSRQPLLVDHSNLKLEKTGKVKEAY